MFKILKAYRIDSRSQPLFHDRSTTSPFKLYDIINSSGILLCMELLQLPLVCSSSSLIFCDLIQGKVVQILSTIKEGFRRFSDRHETLSNALTDSAGTVCRSWVTQNRLSCARLLCKHHQQYSQRGYLPGAGGGGGAGSSLCDRAGGLSLR